MGDIVKMILDYLKNPSLFDFIYLIIGIVLILGLVIYPKTLWRWFIHKLRQLVCKGALPPESHISAHLEEVGITDFLTNKELKERDMPWLGLEGSDANKIEVLVAGRTLKWLFMNKQNELIEGLRKHITFRLLMLDPVRVALSTIDLTPIKLKDSSTIQDDIKQTLAHLSTVLSVAAYRRLPGSLEVYTYQHVIMSSFLALTVHLDRRFQYDFSLSEADGDKYHALFSCSTREENHFGNKMYRFYKGFFEDALHLVSYNGDRQKDQDEKMTSTRQIYPKDKFEELCTAVTTSDTDRLRRFDIGRCADMLVQKYGEIEYVRGDSPTVLVKQSAKLFEAVISDAVIDAPLSVQIELTNKCDANCVHCQRHTWLEKNREGDTTRRDRDTAASLPPVELPIECVLGIIDDMKSMGVETITLSGGEPTLHSDFRRILTAAGKAVGGKRLRVGVLTTGLSIDYELAQLMVAESDWIRVSIDGSNDTVYQKIRRVSGGFARARSAVEMLAKAKANNKGSSCRLAICYTVQKDNLEDIADAAEVLPRWLGLEDGQVLTFKFAHGSSDYVCSKNQVENLINENTLEKIIDADQGNRTNLKYLKRFVHEFSSADSISAGEPLHRYFINNPNTLCFSPYLFALIDASGGVYPCCFRYYDNDEFGYRNTERSDNLIGTISDERRFSDIWRSQDYASTRKVLMRTDTLSLAHSPCRQCTRHFLHNALLTDLYRYYREELDNDTRRLYAIFAADRQEDVRAWL